MAETLYTYGNNDICMTIYPYDNYKRIALFERNDGSDRQYDIDKGETYRYSLEFGDTSSKNKKTVVIRECKDYMTGENSVKLAQNELLFKISQKDAISILSLSSNIFNVVREVVINDGVTEGTVTDKQTMFYGRWVAYNDKYEEDTTKIISSLESRIKELTAQNDDLTAQIVELLAEIAKLTAQVDEYKDYEKYKSMYEDLYSKSLFEQEYTGEAIEHDTKYIKVNIDEETLANRVNDYLDTINM